jgi:tetratricopeptide (TPR) repeat protein
MAAVWLATDERLGRPVAIKVLSDTVAGDQEFLERFSREARVAARLQHPHLVQIYDFDAGERPYLVMEYIEGGNLAERFADREVPAAERLARELLGALRHIHSNGVLHRDVKPHNVLIDAGGHARLTDFGIAQPSDETALTEAGKVIGTESYMAPEVRRGEPASERSDLYATGVVLAEAAGDEGASAALWSLIDGLRESDPDRRPSSATAALAMLERASTPVIEPAEPTEPFEYDAPPPTGDRRRLLALAGLLAAILALATIALASVLSGDDNGDAGGQTAKAAQSNEGNPKPNEPSQGSNEAAVEPTPEPEPQLAGPAPAASGSELNNEGFALSQAGQYEEAIPILQRAVSELEGSSDQLTYGYALFNLAHALRLAGNPEEAIPLLEERLKIPDQLGAVQAELAAARADAGLTESGDAATVPPEEAKPGNGPPPWANSDGAVEADD